MKLKKYNNHRPQQWGHSTKGKTMNKRNVWVTRPKVDNSLRSVMLRHGIKVCRDTCDHKKKYMVSSWKITYHPRFENKVQAYVWVRKNFEWILDQHKPDTSWVMENFNKKYGDNLEC